MALFKCPTSVSGGGGSESKSELVKNYNSGTGSKSYTFSDFTKLKTVSLGGGTIYYFATLNDDDTIADSISNTPSQNIYITSVSGNTINFYTYVDTINIMVTGE